MEPSVQQRDDPNTSDEANISVTPSSNRWLIRRTFYPLMGFCFCFQFGVFGWTILLPQYILARLRATAENVTVTSDLCKVNISDPFYQEEKRLERQASTITSIASFCAGVPAIVAVLLYSSLSDQLGRKVTIAIPYVGGCIVGVAIALMVALNLPFWVYYIASFVLGCSGSSMAMLAGVFASVADITSRERRSIAIAVIQACNGSAMFCANIVLGMWARKAGYVDPIIFLGALMITSGFFFFFIRETRPPNQNRARSLTNQLQHMKRAVGRTRLRKRRIIVLLGAFTLSDLSHMDLQMTLTLYVMGEPFCWGAAIIGGFNAFKVAVLMIGATVGIFILRRCLSDLALSLMGTVSHIGLQVLLGLSSFFLTSLHDVVIAVAVVVGLVAAVPSITLRGLCSSLVAADEQGAVFGVLAIGDVFSTSFGPVIMNGIYAATVTSINFFVFYFSAALLCFALLLLVIYKIFLTEVDDSELEHIIT